MRNSPPAPVSSCGSPRRRNCDGSAVPERKSGNADTCAPSMGSPVLSTTTPAIVPV